MTTLLSLHDVEVAYGHVRAVKGAALEIRPQEIRVLLGANGAGKSSIIRAIMGLEKPRRGRIVLRENEAIQSLPPHKINRLGVAWVPEGRQIFANLTVRENLLVGGFHEIGARRADERLANIFETFPRLRERETQLGGSLSGGEQQMLAIGRALMSEPQLLLLDEPSLGLAPKVVRSLFELVVSIRDSGVSILMAEQNARQALAVADYAYLLEHGVIRGFGSSSEMQAREDVQAAYLGGQAQDRVPAAQVEAPKE